jgi:hypothetical protein
MQLDWLNNCGRQFKRGRVGTVQPYLLETFDGRRAISIAVGEKSITAVMVF